MAKLPYRARTKFIATKNPQANTIIEQLHQALASLCCTFELDKNHMDAMDPWAGILSAATFGMRSMIHMTLNATPGQLVFGHDVILNLQCQADWQAIKQHKQSVINENNLKENSKRIPHMHGVGDKFLLEKDANECELNAEGPCEATAVNENGTLRSKKGTVIDDANIGRCTPCYEKESATQQAVT